MNTLLYKRTHRGDPDKRGIFGHRDCMGQVRRWNFDAVIGLGGKSPWAGHEEIANKINWIGIGPTKIKAPAQYWKGPLVTFERFVLLDGEGPEIKQFAPKLFKHMYEDQHVRALLSASVNSGLQKEIAKILGLAKKQKRKRQSYTGIALIKSTCCIRRKAKPRC